MMRVVSGVAISNGRVLMGKRKLGKLRPQLWELPGGKIEENESSRDALIREWHEEFGVRLADVGSVRISEFTFDLETTIEVELYEVKLESTHINRWKRPDHDELLFVHPWDAVRTYPCSPGFYVHYADLRQYMQDTDRWIKP